MIERKHKNMADIQIITDAGSDLLKEEQERFGIEVIPIKITADGKDYLSGVDVFSDEFYELLETCKEIPHTSQPSTADIYDVFQKHIEAGKQILVISLSSNASGFYNNMHLAKNMILEENPNAVIEILDSRSFAYIYGQAAINASQMAKDGMGILEIKEKTKEFIESYGVFVIPKSLTYLEKGGRINKASLIFGNMLDLAPVLTIKDGLMEAVGKVRGRKKLAKKLFQYLVSHAPDQTGKDLIVVNGKMDEETEELLGYLTEQFPGVNITRAKVGPTIATHIGPVFGVFFQK